jgi:hypothetical protein
MGIAQRGAGEVGGGGGVQCPLTGNIKDSSLFWKTCFMRNSELLLETFSGD